MSCSIRVYGGQHYVSVICTCSDCEAGRPCPHQKALEPPSITNMSEQVVPKPPPPRNFPNPAMIGYDPNKHCTKPELKYIPHKDNIYIDMRGNQNYNNSNSSIMSYNKSTPNNSNNSNNFQPNTNNKILDDKERLARIRLPVTPEMETSLLRSKRFGSSSFDNQSFVSNQIRNLMSENETPGRPLSRSSDPDRSSIAQSEVGSWRNSNLSDPERSSLMQSDGIGSWRSSYCSRPSSSSLDLKDYGDISSQNSSIWSTPTDHVFSDTTSMQYEDSFDSSSLSKEIQDTFNNTSQQTILTEEEFTSPW